jgi:hypothetical protein
MNLDRILVRPVNSQKPRDLSPVIFSELNIDTQDLELSRAGNG